MEPKNLKIVVITGMSGAGKTVAMQSFEDMGYFCVDNMPPSLLSQLVDMVEKSDDIDRVCLVIDLRSREFFQELQKVIVKMDNTSFVEARVLFLEASDSELVSRYKETRRNHPLQQQGGTVLDAIRKERQELAPIRAASQMVIDTSALQPRELRETLMREFYQPGDKRFTVEVMSFGFKYGIPIDSDIVMDVRFLPNPHYVEELRPLNGCDQEVYDYVMASEDTETFYEKFRELIDFTLPLYEAEGKTSLTVSIGCTGGQHRSVALAERLARHVADDLGYATHVTHRDINKRKETVNRS